MFLEARIDGGTLQFAWSLDGKDWQSIPAALDQGLLSDEAGMDGAEQFTGAFIGMSAHDLTGSRKPADFRWYEYRGLEHKRVFNG